MIHTKEPWSIGTPPPNGEQTIGDRKGMMVAVTTTGYGVDSLSNASRIVACVNACAGIPTEELEAFEVNGFAAAIASRIKEDKHIDDLQAKVAALEAERNHFRELFGKACDNAAYEITVREEQRDDLQAKVAALEAELAKYRNAPVVAWHHPEEGLSYENHFVGNIPLIIKPEES